MKKSFATGVFITCLIGFGALSVQKIVRQEVKKIAIEETSEYALKKTASKKILKETFTKTTSKTLKQSFRKQDIAKIIPSGNGGINKEMRTLLEIVKTPLTENLITGFKSYCKTAKISAESMNAILKDFSAPKKLVKPSVNRHVDFSPVAVVLGNFPSKEELALILKSKGMAVTAENIRAVHYDIAREAFAKKYGVTKKQAEHIIGILDCVIHEAEDGTIQIVPNNIHRYKDLYSHNGLVAKRLEELAGIKGYIEE